jgi:RNA polymerase sigma-70 factor (ECF subfamily)
MSTDAEILRGSVDDPAAFADIFERHIDAVLGYAQRRVGATHGEEIAAQTFLVAFERRTRFDPSYGSARPWLLGIATNLIRHHLRHERVHLAALRRLPAEPPIDPVDDPDRVDAERLMPAVADALLALSANDRATFLLVALGEVTYAEAARSLGIPVGTVRSRIHRARLLLRERLGGLEATTEEQT